MSEQLTENPIERKTEINKVKAISTSVPIESGLDFILSHLEKPYFPRRISTYLTEKSGPWQVLVNSRDEAIASFKESNLLNCRISAYQFPVPVVRGINAQVPNFFMSDLDRKSFKTNKSLQQCLQDKLHGANPSVLWSGGGYRILQPLDADVDVILEMESIFAKFHEPSRGLMRYAEKLMTYGKADSNHSNNVSFGNCMVRIPGSYNAKYIQFDDNGQIVNIPPKSEVKIVQPLIRGEKLSTNQSTLEVAGARTIDQIRKDGIDKQLKQRIAAERAEMQRIKDQTKERLPGQFISLRQDKETRTFLFTGQWQKLLVPAKDFVTKQEIPGKTVTKYRFQVYDLTTFDSNNPAIKQTPAYNLGLNAGLDYSHVARTNNTASYNDACAKSYISTCRNSVICEVGYTDGQNQTPFDKTNTIISDTTGGG